MPGECCEVLPFETNPPQLCQALPQSYSTVPAVALNNLSASVPERSCRDFGSSLLRAKARENCWLEEVSKLLQTELTKSHSIAWAVHHAKLQPEVLDLPAVTALLPFPTKRLTHRQ